jgi:hypothetical protein
MVRAAGTDMQPGPQATSEYEARYPTLTRSAQQDVLLPQTQRRPDTTHARIMESVHRLA